MAHDIVIRGGHLVDRTGREPGRILERGSHDELMQIEGGAYRGYVELQRGDVG